MSGEEKKIVGDSFEAARKRVEEAYQGALQETNSKVERAKSEALRKLGVAVGFGVGVGVALGAGVGVGVGVAPPVRAP